MSLGDRRRFLVGAAGLTLLLSGCVRPLLATGGGADGLTGQIAMPEIGDRFDYHLEQSLRDRLGDPVASPQFALTVQSQQRERDFNIARDRSVTRIQIEVSADWILRRAATNQIVRRGTTEVAAGYNSTASLFASRQIRRDVERRLAIDLGQRISLALLANGDAILYPEKLAPAVPSDASALPTEAGGLPAQAPAPPMGTLPLPTDAATSTAPTGATLPPSGSGAAPPGDALALPADDSVVQDGP